MHEPAPDAGDDLGLDVSDGDDHAAPALEVDEEMVGRDLADDAARAVADPPVLPGALGAQVVGGDSSDDLVVHLEADPVDLELGTGEGAVGLEHRPSAAVELAALVVVVGGHRAELARGIVDPSLALRVPRAGEQVARLLEGGGLGDPAVLLQAVDRLGDHAVSVLVEREANLGLVLALLAVDRAQLGHVLGVLLDEPAEEATCCDARVLLLVADEAQDRSGVPGHGPLDEGEVAGGEQARLVEEDHRALGDESLVAGVVVAGDDGGDGAGLDGGLLAEEDRLRAADRGPEDGVAGRLPGGDGCFHRRGLPRASASDRTLDPVARGREGRDEGSLLLGELGEAGLGEDLVADVGGNDPHSGVAAVEVERHGAPLEGEHGTGRVEAGERNGDDAAVAAADDVAPGSVAAPFELDDVVEGEEAVGEILDRFAREAVAGEVGERLDDRAAVEARLVLGDARDAEQRPEGVVELGLGEDARAGETVEDVVEGALSEPGRVHALGPPPGHLVEAEPCLLGRGCRRRRPGEQTPSGPRGPPPPR